MTRKEMIGRINELANRYTGCDGLYGIKRYQHARLVTMLEAYEKMIAFNEKANAILSTHGYTINTALKFALMGDTAPAWYKEYWSYRAAALEIWRSKF